MDIGPASHEDLADLAHLLWLHALPEEQDLQTVDAFAVDLGQWLAGPGCSHHAFVARGDDGRVVGMAWLALVPRVPRPGTTTRASGDIQSVFVLPEARGKGIGGALIEAVTTHAQQLGADRVNVHSGRKAVALYERLGFASSQQLLQTADRRPPDGSDRQLLAPGRGVYRDARRTA